MKRERSLKHAETDIRRRDQSIPGAPPRRARTRRVQEARSTAAKERLLKATVNVLIDRGYGGLTTKEVAARAGFSNGALVHHYATKADLVVAGTAYVYDEAVRRSQTSVKTAAARRDPVGTFISDCFRVYFEWPFLAALEVMVVARTDPTLAAQIHPVMRRYRDLTNEVWLEVFRRSGFKGDDAIFALNITLNLVRGMALNSLWARDMKFYRWLLRKWTELIRRDVGSHVPQTS